MLDYRDTNILHTGSEKRILPHWTLRKCQTQDSICDIGDRQIPVQQSSIRIGTSASLFPDPDK